MRIRYKEGLPTSIGEICPHQASPQQASMQMGDKCGEAFDNMAEGILNRLDKFVYSVARHGSNALVLLAALAFNFETAAPARTYAVIETSTPHQTSKAVIGHSGAASDTSDIMFGLQTEIALQPAIDGTAPLPADPSPYSIQRTIRHFDARGSPTGRS
jgi:hypothetical protein